MVSRQQRECTGRAMGQGSKHWAARAACPGMQPAGWLAPSGIAAAVACERSPCCCPFAHPPLLGPPGVAIKLPGAESYRLCRELLDGMVLVGGTHEGLGAPSWPPGLCMRVLRMFCAWPGVLILSLFLTGVAPQMSQLTHACMALPAQVDSSAIATAIKVRWPG